MNPAPSSASGMGHRERPRAQTFLSGSAAYLLSNVVCGLLPFALLPILTRYLSTQEYGQVAMFQTLVAALGAMVGLSVAGAATRKYYDDGLTREDLRDYIGACMQILGVSTLAAWAALLLLHHQLTAWLDLDRTWLFMALVAAASGFVVQILLGQWQVRKRATAYAGFQISSAVLNLLFSLLLVVAIPLAAQGRLAAIAATAVLSALLAIVILSRDHLLAIVSWRPEFQREALRFGLPLLPHTLGIFLLASVDRFVIAREIGVAQAGIYMVAVQLALAPALVFDAINKAFVPWLFERLKRNDAREKVQIVHATYAWFAAILSFAGVTFLAAPLVVGAVAGPGYEAAGDVLGWLVLGQVFGGMYLMVTNYVFYSRRTAQLALSTATCGVIHLLLLLGVVRWMGMEGAAMTFAATMALRFLLTWWVAQRSCPMPWSLRSVTA